MEFDRLAKRVMHMTAGAFTAMTWQKELPVRAAFKDTIKVTKVTKGVVTMKTSRQQERREKAEFFLLRILDFRGEHGISSRTLSSTTKRTMCVAQSVTITLCTAFTTSTAELQARQSANSTAQRVHLVMVRYLIYSL